MNYLCSHICLLFFHLTQPPETCIGCLQTPSNIKLVKLCAGQSQGECVQCYCRPMWCLECLCKWWVSRQQQDKPETWLGSTSPCPTCRSKFCLLDVCSISSWQGWIMVVWAPGWGMLVGALSYVRVFATVTAPFSQVPIRMVFNCPIC